MTPKLRHSLLFALLAFLCGSIRAAEPIDLKTEALVEPVGLDTTTPRFSWRLETERPGAKQAAWQVQVATSPDKFAAPDLWDSGWVESDTNAWNAYAGQPLQAFQHFFWRVRLREENGTVTAWSQTARAEMGPLAEADWQSAAWLKSPDYAPDKSETPEKFVRHAITQEGNREFGEKSLREIIRPLPLLRREFDLPFEPVRARAFLSAVGYADLRVNGEAASDRVLDPAYTHYPLRRLFSTIDLTGKLKKGANALGIALGSGWAESFFQLRVQRLKGSHYGRPEVRLLVLAEGPMGEREWIATDDQWKMTEGPVRRSHLFVGEQFDARLLPDGWDKPGFDDSKWQTPPQGEPFTGVLASMQSPPERVISTMKPKSVREVAPGIWSVEFPEVATGWVRLKVKDAKPGQTILLRPTLSIRGAPWDKERRRGSEKPILHYDALEKPVDGLGGLDNEFHIIGETSRVPMKRLSDEEKAKLELSTATATYAYTCKGGTAEEWTPRFTYHPFRYVEVIGYPGTPTADSLTAEVVHSDLPKNGTADPGDEKLAWLRDVFLRTGLYCAHGVMQDNANVERGGYVCESFGSFRFFRGHLDCSAFLQKHFDDFQAQADKDSLQHQAPSAARGGGTGIMDFSQIVLVHFWENFLHYGDRRSLERYFPMFELYLDTFWEISREGDIDLFRGVGDWQAPEPINGPRPEQTWKDNLQIVGGFSSSLTDIRLSVGAFHIAALQAGIDAARILGKDGARWEARRDDLKQRLRERFFDGRGYGSPAGDVFALAYDIVASPAERETVAADLNRRIVEDWGGRWGVGQTALHELPLQLARHGYVDTAHRLFLAEGYPGYWSNLEPPRTTLSPGWKAHTIRQVQQVQSRGGVWFTEGLAGIRPDPTHPGFKHFILQPQFPTGHPSASATLMTAQGEIASAWKREGGQIVWNITIPWNSTATVKLPDGRREEVAAGKHQFIIETERN